MLMTLAGAIRMELLASLETTKMQKWLPSTTCEGTVCRRAMLRYKFIAQGMVFSFITGMKGVGQNAQRTRAHRTPTENTFLCNLGHGRARSVKPIQFETPKLLIMYHTFAEQNLPNNNKYITICSPEAKRNLGHNAPPRTNTGPALLLAVRSVCVVDVTPFKQTTMLR